MHASRLMLTGIEELVAIWNGQPARAPGGTADVVDEARHAGLAVHVIRPTGSGRG